MRPMTLHSANKSRAMAEKLFNRKADPEAMMEPKAFLKMKGGQANMFMRGLRMRPRMSKENTEAMSKGMAKIKAGAKTYGKNVVGGAKIVGSAVKSGIKKVLSK